jgi:3-hydroxyacyl-CoA dehydrogenase
MMSTVNLQNANVLVVGAGIMGAGIAQVALLVIFTVTTSPFTGTYE